MLALNAGGTANLDAGIEVMKLGRVAETGSHIRVDYDSIRTSAGLEEVKRLYPGIQLMEQGKEPSLYRSDNGEECPSGRSTILGSMLLHWSNADRAFRRIIVEASKGGCEDTASKR